MPDTPHILLVDDESNVRRVLSALLEQAGYSTVSAAGADEAMGLVRAQDPDLVLTDLKMPGRDGMELLRQLRDDFPEIPVIMLTAHGSVETAVEAMKRGALDFLTKPFEKSHVLEVVGKALGQAERSRREFQGPSAEGASCGFAGSSEALGKLCRMIDKVAPSPATILITGETGTGKELVADALHRGSPRREGPMVRINCGALPENLIEAELFGYERGAFTGADRSKPGRFELADGGTLFLDEIGELPPTVQVKLLRVLQDGVIDRVGGVSPRTVDVRLLAATHRDLERSVQEGSFREDLLYRLRVVELHVPPLRERTGDVEELTNFFLERQSRRLGRESASISPEAMVMLESHAWPGNVRELQNAVERALLLGGPTLEPEDFGLSPGAETPVRSSGLKEAARAAAELVERRMIRAALETTRGNVTRAAEKLGLSRRGLQLKMKELSLRAPAPDDDA